MPMDDDKLRRILGSLKVYVTKEQRSRAKLFLRACKVPHGDLEKDESLHGLYQVIRKNSRIFRGYDAVTVLQCALREVGVSIDKVKLLGSDEHSLDALLDDKKLVALLLVLRRELRQAEFEDMKGLAQDCIDTLPDNISTCDDFFHICLNQRVFEKEETLVEFKGWLETVGREDLSKKLEDYINEWKEDGAAEDELRDVKDSDEHSMQAIYRMATRFPPRIDIFMESEVHTQLSEIDRFKSSQQMRHLCLLASRIIPYTQLYGKESIYDVLKELKEKYHQNQAFLTLLKMMEFAGFSTERLARLSSLLSDEHDDESIDFSYQRILVFIADNLGDGELKKVVNALTDKERGIAADQVTTAHALLYHMTNGGTLVDGNYESLKILMEKFKAVGLKALADKVDVIIQAVTSVEGFEEDLLNTHNFMEGMAHVPDDPRNRIRVFDHEEEPLLPHNTHLKVPMESSKPSLRDKPLFSLNFPKPTHLQMSMDDDQLRRNLGTLKGHVTKEQLSGAKLFLRGCKVPHGDLENVESLLGLHQAIQKNYRIFRGCNAITVLQCALREVGVSVDKLKLLGGDERSLDALLQDKKLAALLLGLRRELRQAQFEDLMGLAQDCIDTLPDNISTRDEFFHICLNQRVFEKEETLVEFKGWLELVGRDDLAKTLDDYIKQRKQDASRSRRHTESETGTSEEEERSPHRLTFGRVQEESGHPRSQDLAVGSDASYPIRQPADPATDRRVEQVEEDLERDGNTMEREYGGLSVQNPSVQGGDDIESRETNHRLFEEAMQSGYVLRNLFILLLIGVAGSGKTCFSQLVLGRPPPAVRDSTPLAQAAIRVVSTSRATVSGTVWRIVSPTELISMLADAIKGKTIFHFVVPLPIPPPPSLPYRKEGVFNRIMSMFKRSPADDSKAAVPQRDNAEDLLTTKSRPSLENLIAKSPSVQSMMTHMSQANPTTASKEVFSENWVYLTDSGGQTEFHELLPKSMMTHMSQANPTTASKEVFSENWVYLTDSGGQPQFHELLPTFIHHVSGAAIFVKLNEDLSSHPTIGYYEGGKLCGSTYSSSLTHEQTIKNCLQMMQSRLNISGDNDCPALFFVGTHKDCKSDSSESVESKDKQICEMLTSLKGLKEHVVFSHNAEPKRLLYEVNARNPGVKDSQTSAEFRQAVMEGCKKIEQKIPLRWFMLEQRLQELAREKSQLVLSLDECLEVASEFEMDKPRLLAALDHFVRLNLFKFFPKVLPNVVFTTSQVLLDKISELVAYRYHLKGVPDTDPSSAKSVYDTCTLRFRDHAIVNANFLKLFDSHYRYTDNLFTPQELLDILSNRLVFALLTGEDYFMPCVLPELPLDEVSAYRLPSTSPVAPLLIYYAGGLFSTGLFSGLIAFLQDRSSWKVAEKSNEPICLFKNCVMFRNSDFPITFTLIYSYEFIEVHVQVAKGFITEPYTSVRTTLFHGLDRAAKIQGCNNLSLKVGFFCPCGKECSHLATVRDNGKWLVCSIDETCRGFLAEQQDIWLSDYYEIQHIDSSDSAKSQGSESSQQRDTHHDEDKLHDFVSLQPQNESLETEDVLQFSQQEETLHEENKLHISSPPQKLFFSNYHERDRVVSQYYNCAEYSTHIPFIDPITVITCDHKGIEHTLVDHDITLTIPAGVIPKGKVVHFEVGVALYGPVSFPSNIRPISPILWLCPQEDIEFNQPFMVTFPHFLNDLNQQELAQLEVAFAKADHKDFSESKYNYGQNAMCFDFQPCSVQPRFSYKDQQGFAMLETTHCCLICLTAKQCPQLARKSGFLLTRFDHFSESLTHDVTFCVSFCLKSCLKVLISQFPAVPLKNTRPQRFNFKPNSSADEDSYEDLEITIHNKHEDKYVGDIHPSHGKIKLLTVDFWKRGCSVESMEVDQDILCLYPPRICIKFRPQGKLGGNCQSRVQVKVSGYISDSGNLDSEIHLPLFSSSTPLPLFSNELTPATGLSLPDSATQLTASSPIDEKDWVEVVDYLKPLNENQIKQLGGWLGLSASNLDRMKNLPDDLVKAWFRKEDNVLKNCGTILTWETLAQKLVKIEQHGIAETILKEKCGVNGSGSGKDGIHDDTSASLPTAKSGPIASKQLELAEPNHLNGSTITPQPSTSLSLQESFRLLLPVANEWQNIGTLLGVPSDTLEQIESGNPREINCLRVMLMKQTDPPPSRETLADALKSLGYQTLAENVGEKFPTST